VAEPTREQRLDSPFGPFAIERFGAARNRSLQAYNSADRLLLDKAYELKLAGEQILTINDTFGALSIPTQATVTWTDSAVARDAILHNAEVCGQTPPHVIPSIESPLVFATNAHCVLMQIPKQLAYFEQQLEALAAGPGGLRLFAAGMDKHLAPGTADIIEKYFGCTERHRGKQKARLFSALLDSGSTPPISRRNQIAPSSYWCEPIAQHLTAGSNVFSRQGLDQGSALLIHALGELPRVNNVLDLGCGNGVLGLASALTKGATHIAFCDESAQAIASARHNATHVLPPDVKADFYWCNGLTGYSGAQVERILCNPPFHAGHVVDAAVGRHLLGACSEHLVSGGELVFVANRHLDYRGVLKKQFCSQEVIASDRRFVVTRALKR